MVVFTAGTHLRAFWCTVRRRWTLGQAALGVSVAHGDTSSGALSARWTILARNPAGKFRPNRSPSLCFVAADRGGARRSGRVFLEEKRKALQLPPRRQSSCPPCFLRKVGLPNTSGFAGCMGSSQGPFLKVDATPSWFTGADLIYASRIRIESEARLRASDTWGELNLCAASYLAPGVSSESGVSSGAASSR